MKKANIIKVYSRFPIEPKFQPFFFTATQGQVQFVLPSYPTTDGMLSVCINGVAQNSLNGDFTINGLTLTMNAQLDNGDQVSGFYMVKSPINNPAILNYRQFYFDATAGQQNFTLLSLPAIMVLVSINGTSQSQQNGDYTVNGLVLRTSAPLNLHDKLFGVYIEQ